MKITGKIVKAFLDEFDRLNNLALDWLIASWEKGLKKIEKRLAQSKYEEFIDERKKFLNKWKNL